MRERSGHYMPVSLLGSQFATLEEPLDEEDVVVLPIDLAPDTQLQLALQALAAHM
jgi:gluconokinase